LSQECRSHAFETDLQSPHGTADEHNLYAKAHFVGDEAPALLSNILFTAQASLLLAWIEALERNVALRFPRRGRPRLGGNLPGPERCRLHDSCQCACLLGRTGYGEQELHRSREVPEGSPAVDMLARNTVYLSRLR